MRDVCGVPTRSLNPNHVALWVRHHRKVFLDEYLIRCLVEVIHVNERLPPTRRAGTGHQVEMQIGIRSVDNLGDHHVEQHDSHNWHDLSVVPPHQSDGIHEPSRLASAGRIRQERVAHEEAAAFDKVYVTPAAYASAL